jgi:hypothetical protein
MVSERTDNMNIRKLLEEAEPVIGDLCPEPSVYELLVNYFESRIGHRPAEAHRLASRYIDELLKMGNIE